jgi:hypothetical protein
MSEIQWTNAWPGAVFGLGDMNLQSQDGVDHLYNPHIHVDNDGHIRLYSQDNMILKDDQACDLLIDNSGERDVNGFFYSGGNIYPAESIVLVKKKYEDSFIRRRKWSSNIRKCLSYRGGRKISEWQINSSDVINCDNGRSINYDFLHSRDCKFVMSRWENVVIPKKKAIQLAPEYYGEQQYISENKTLVVKDYDGLHIKPEDAVCLVDRKGLKKWFHSTKISPFKLSGFIQAYSGFNLPKGRKLAYNELEYLNVFVKKHHSLHEEKFLGRRIVYSNEEERDVLHKKLEETLEHLTRRDGIPLKSPEILSGGAIGVDQSFSLDRKSISTIKTGRIGYSYGVEFETSYGDISDKKCEMLGLSKQGDASILANEYVTRPLHGDVGIGMIETYADVLSQSCGVTNTDSIHVHVGGADNIESPIYNVPFSMNAINLGKQIEDELFAIVPPHRRGNRFCSTVKDFMRRFSYDKMSDDPTMLSRYIFDESYPFSRERHRSLTELSKWADGRYKWLNLLNCNSINGRSRTQSFKTVEFRLFPGSLDAEEVKHYIKMSLAFVWFVENRQSRVKAGNVSLGEVIDTSIRNSLEANRTLDFIDEKKELYSKDYSIKDDPIEEECHHGTSIDWRDENPF